MSENQCRPWRDSVPWRLRLSPHLRAGLMNGVASRLSSEKRPARIVTPQRERDAPGSYVSQAPQAVRSACGRRRHRISPSTACAGRTLQADKCNAFRLTADVHRPSNISGTAAARAVFRIHSSPSVAKESSTNSRSQSHKVNPVTKHEHVRVRTRQPQHLPLSRGYVTAESLAASEHLWMEHGTASRPSFRRLRGSGRALCARSIRNLWIWRLPRESWHERGQKLDQS